MTIMRMMGGSTFSNTSFSMATSFENFNGDLECINVREQILQGSYGLKREKKGKCEVECS